MAVKFDEGLTVLIARNGAGKTAVLDAISVVLGPLIGSFYLGEGKGIYPGDVHLRLTHPALNEMETQYPAVIAAAAMVDDAVIEWSRSFNTPKSGTTIKAAKPLTGIGERLQEAVKSNRRVVLPLIAYYGTGRLWRRKRRAEKKVFETEFYSRTSGYQDCLDSASSYKPKKSS